MRHGSYTASLRLQIIPAAVNKLYKNLHMFMLEVFRDHKIRGAGLVETGHGGCTPSRLHPFLNWCVILSSLTAAQNLDWTRPGIWARTLERPLTIPSACCALSVQNIAFQVSQQKNIETTTLLFVFEYTSCALVPHYKYKLGICLVPLFIRFTLYFSLNNLWPVTHW